MKIEKNSAPIEYQHNIYITQKNIEPLKKNIN